MTRECKAKFGDDLGLQIWEEINKVFDCMPLAALVDEKVKLFKNSFYCFIFSYFSRFFVFMVESRVQ